MNPEFGRRYPLDAIGAAPRTVSIEADAAERESLARRFDLVTLESLKATATLHAVAGGAEARGTIHAAVVQACVVSGEPVAATLEEPFALRFADDAYGAEAGEEGVELNDTDCDVLPLESGAVDLGEAVAQTLGLALDPFPRSPAEQAREDERKWSAGEEAGPFAGLKGLLGG